MNRTPASLAALACALFASALLPGCSTNPAGVEGSTPVHEGTWGIYLFDRATEDVSLIYTSENSIHRLDLSSDGLTLVFEEDFGSNVFTDSEICVVGTDGFGFSRLTYNNWLDSSPCWSPDDSEILYLSWPDYPANTMDIYVMDADTFVPSLLYDSGFHDGDCDWEGDRIAFTRQSQVWIMNDDGTNPYQVTDYVLAGIQGDADLPFGDYDPRIRPGGDIICFERMIDDRVFSGNYDFFTVTTVGTGETRITTTEYSQFIAEWSPHGDELVFTVAAIDSVGLYDMYVMDEDGSDYRDITPYTWPIEFLCSHPVFSRDASQIYFVGEWWE
jgi:Tol biopolymer transport system component